MKNFSNKGKAVLAAAIWIGGGLGSIPAAQAATWSDAWVHFAYGTRFAEPGYGQSIAKRIVGFSYAGGDG
ncbi:MAG: hypothetical protein ACYCSR_12605, partial [Thiomonas sp.]